jgi:hypothetical protein
MAMMTDAPINVLNKGLLLLGGYFNNRHAHFASAALKYPV